MELEEIRFDRARPVEGYGPGFFRIGGALLRGNVLVTPEAARLWSGPEDMAPLLALSGSVDVLLYGTGAVMGRAPAAMMSALDAVGISVDAMASDAAARTYNVLLSEGRRVAAALLAVD
ncbi:MAG TPA: Mth938-like domain-containing protein [Albidovulum sp.]|uniref:Mth938-like domain-containing protein n=1 Tax=Albidovulum sp. TaxID=1872424 RepID=UPI002CD6CF62|nr:Mth938-like domain-containing protein [Albidovulum sp.]